MGGSLVVVTLRRILLRVRSFLLAAAGLPGGRSAPLTKHAVLLSCVSSLMDREGRLQVEKLPWGVAVVLEGTGYGSCQLLWGLLAYLLDQFEPLLLNVC